MDNENVRNHDEMMEEALRISPNARVRLLDDESGRWEIYILTEYITTYNLPERYKGTPAWEMYSTYESTYGDELSRWIERGMGIRCAPIEAAADYYNIKVEIATVGKALLEGYLEEQGFVESDLQHPTQEKARIYISSSNRAEKEANEQLADKLAEVRSKWNGIF